MNQEEMLALAATELAEYKQAVIPITDDFTFDASAQLAIELSSRTGVMSLRIDMQADENGNRFLIISDQASMMTGLKRWLTSKLN